MHILLVGPSHCGMTELARDITRQLPHAYGFETESMPPDKSGAFPVYIHNLRKPRVYTEENRIGYCRHRHGVPHAAGFAAITRELRAVPNGAFVVMNQLGRMERGHAAFRDAVRSLFERCTVFAVIRDMENPFLLSLQDRNDALIFYMEDLDPAAAAEAVRKEAAKAIP